MSWYKDNALRMKSFWKKFDSMLDKMRKVGYNKYNETKKSKK